MGRKIPGKKHRGVKDPLKQQAIRQAELETKINEPPKDVNEQSIPKSLKDIVKLKEAVKSGRVDQIKKKKKKKNPLICVGGQNPRPMHPKARPEKVVPIFQQKPGESEERFLHRVNRETHAFLNETAFEKKYGVQVNRNPETGNIEGLSKCYRTELDKIEMLRAKHKNLKKKKKKRDDGEIGLTKDQKRKEKLKLKKEKKEQDQIDEFENFKDHVEFGEVAHEPPQIKTRPRAADLLNSTKPGKKDLLLYSLLKKNKASKMSSTKSIPIDMTGKRKNLPVGERRKLEKDQNDVIAAYRRLKAQKSAGVNI